MRSTSGDWADSNFQNHLWWHTALFHLDLGQSSAVLDVYDQHLRADSANLETYNELDSTALLWRLFLLEVDVGPRWKELADKWQRSMVSESATYAFNDVHAMMALWATTGRR